MSNRTLQRIEVSTADHALTIYAVVGSEADITAVLILVFSTTNAAIVQPKGVFCYFIPSNCGFVGKRGDNMGSARLSTGNDIEWLR